MTVSTHDEKIEALFGHDLRNRILGVTLYDPGAHGGG